jgi:hypothetical protein
MSATTRLLRSRVATSYNQVQMKDGLKNITYQSRTCGQSRGFLQGFLQARGYWRLMGPDKLNAGLDTRQTKSNIPRPRDAPRPRPRLGERVYVLSSSSSKYT